MKKLFKHYALIWAIFFVLFNAVVFLVPRTVEVDGMTLDKYAGSFWPGYVAILLAFIGNLYCTYKAFSEENKDRVFLSMPLYSFSRVCLIVTAVIGIVTMLIIDLPSWIGAIICLAVLAFYAVKLIKADAAKEAVADIDAKVKAKTLFVKPLTVEAESLLSRATTPEAKGACKKVFETMRYSDPMSSDALADLESLITLKFNAFSNAVTDGAENISALADELVALIDDRNKKCKLLK